MNSRHTISRLEDILEKVLNRSVEITLETDLIKDGILDSLDGMVFMLEVEQEFGKTFPQDLDLVAEGYYNVGTLIDKLKV